MKKIMNEIGRLVFSETDVPIMGVRIGGTCEIVSGYLVCKRSLPCLDDNFKPNGKRYERWETIRGNCSWFFETKAEAEVFAYQLGLGE